MRVLILLSLVAATVAFAQPQPTQPFGVQDLIRLQRLSDIQISADGAHLLFTLRTTDIAANRGRNAIWQLDATRRGAQPLRVTADDADASSGEWSADGRFIYFLSRRGGSAQVWRVTDAGADELQVTHLPLDVGSFRVSPTGDRILVSMAVFPDCADLACTTRRLDSAAAAPATGVLHTRIFVRHWDVWSDGRRSQLFSLPLDDTGAHGEPVNLTAGLDGDVPGKPYGGREDYVFSPDGTRVAFSVRAVGIGEPWSTNYDIYETPAVGGSRRNLTADNPAWDGQPAYSPDGSQLAYLATERPGYESDKFHLVTLNLKSGETRPLTKTWDRSIAAFAWSRDGKSLFAETAHLGQRPLWAIDATTGRASAITGAGHVDSFGIGASRVFYAQSTLGNAADLYSVSFGGGRAQQLTHVNQALMATRKLGEYEQFNFPGWNEDNLFGYVVKPVDFKSDRKYPVAVLIHGGPEGSMANEWSFRWNAQIFAGAGYGVVMIDFHGSTGYGQAFTDSVNGDWGGKPFEDVKKGIEAALKQYPWLDGTQMCALGGSFGGYMVNWIAGQWPDRFKCLVSHAGIFDNRSMYYSTEELWFPEWENGAPEYVNPAAYSKHNPVDYVSKWKTPTLVIAGQLDYRVPYTQGLSVFTALQRQGVPSEFLYFPDENHWVLKPANSVQWYDTVLAWLNRWTASRP